MTGDYPVYSKCPVDVSSYPALIIDEITSQLCTKFPWVRLLLYV